MKKIFLKQADITFFDQGKGLTFLFIHGFPFDGRFFWETGRQLASDRFRALIPDLPGFGASHWKYSNIKGNSVSDEISIVSFAETLNDFLSELEKTEKTSFTKNVILVGQSMGGYIAMEFVRRFADRLAGIILCDTKTSQDAPNVVDNRLRLAQTVKESGMKPVAAQMLPNLLSEETLKNKSFVVDFVRTTMEEQLTEGVALASKAMARRLDTTELLKEISVPLLMLVGNQDKPSPPNTMRQMQEFAEQARSFQFEQNKKCDQINSNCQANSNRQDNLRSIPVELIEFQNAGHLPQLECPALFLDAIRNFGTKIININRL